MEDSSRGRLRGVEHNENKGMKVRLRQETGGLPPSIPEVGDELLGLEEGLGCLRPLVKGKRGFLDAGLMDLTIEVAAGLYGCKGSAGEKFLLLSLPKRSKTVAGPVLQIDLVFI